LEALYGSSSMQSGASVGERLLELPEQIDRSSIAARAREDDEGRGPGAFAKPGDFPIP
jgi:hypothetical protein